ncbi:MAG: hypothetical protein ACFFD2_12140 [Promethearchaeota archaeon]
MKIPKNFKRLLKSNGRMVLLDATSEMYTNEWASFTRKDFLENRFAKSGDKVKIIITCVEDKTPVIDILWTDAYYQESFKRAGLEII